MSFVKTVVILGYILNFKTFIQVRGIRVFFIWKNQYFCLEESVNYGWTASTHFYLEDFMGINNILSLLGGLALFLWGMDSMGNGLEAACGNKMKSILEKLTSNRFIGVLVGAAITAVIQSSSATTVMVVGFVNAGMMTLSQAIWIIMGANIGTTVTGLLIALDVGLIAPIVAIIGVVMMLFIKNQTVNEIGKI